MTSLRRMYQNACEAAGISEADRKHGSGHNPSSRAYLVSLLLSIAFGHIAEICVSNLTSPALLPWIPAEYF